MIDPAPRGGARSASWRLGPAGAAGAIVVALLSFVYLPIFFGQVIFFRDPALWNHPARAFLGSALRTGDSPFWNPDVGLGLPVLANPLYGVFYPPNWLFALVEGEGVVQMLTWQSFAHLVWGSVGVLLVARRLGTTALGAAVAGLVWGLSGYTTAQWTAGLLLLGDAWVPWSAVGCLALVAARGDGKRALALGVVKAALPLGMALLCGEVFIAMMGVAFGLLTAAAALAAEATGGPHLARGAARSFAQARAPLRLAAAALAAVILGAGLGAVCVLPARAQAVATARAAPLPKATAESCSLHPLRTLEFVAPGSMGYAYERYPAREIVGQRCLDGLPLSYSVYLGAGAAALALIALGRGRRLPALLLGLSLVALVVAFGRHAPLHGWLRVLVPPLGYMRYPEKYMVLVVGWFALLAGHGADRLLVGRGARPWRRPAAIAAALAALAALAARFFSEEWAPFVREGATQGAVAAAMILALAALAPRRPRAAAALLLATVAFDLAAAAWPLQSFGPAGIATAVPPAAAAVRADHARGPAGAEARAGDRPRVFRSEDAERIVNHVVAVDSNPTAILRSMQTLVPNAMNPFGLATLPGYDAAVSTRFLDLWNAGVRRGPEVLRLFGVDHAVLPAAPGAPAAATSALDPLLDPLPGARLYRVRDPLPPVYLAARAEVVPDDAAEARLFAPDIVAGGRALLAPEAAGGALAAEAKRAGRCTLRARSNARVVADCHAEAPAVAVFVDQFDPGWRAEVNGVPAPLLRANVVLRAVRVPAGTSVIALTYEAPLDPGRAVSVAALLLIAGVACAALLAARRPSHARG